MPDPTASFAPIDRTILFDAPIGDVMAARSAARTLLTPPPPADIAAIATLMVTAALLQAGVTTDDRVTGLALQTALAALLNDPRRSIRDDLPVFVHYAAAERLELCETQSRHLVAWMEDHFGVGARQKDPQ